MRNSELIHAFRNFWLRKRVPLCSFNACRVWITCARILRGLKEGGGAPKKLPVRFRIILKKGFRFFAVDWA
jgi:hypothetical protein